MPHVHAVVTHLYSGAIEQEHVLLLFSLFDLSLFCLIFNLLWKKLLTNKNDPQTSEFSKITLLEDTTSHVSLIRSHGNSLSSVTYSPDVEQEVVGGCAFYS